MSGGKRGARPVGRGYMPKGGAAAARAVNDQWQRERAASEAAAAAPSATGIEPDARERARFGPLSVEATARIGLGASLVALVGDLVLAVTR